MICNKSCKHADIDFMLRNYTPEAKSLVKLLLSRDPAKRPTASQALKHPWFSLEKPILKSSLLLNRVFAKIHNDSAFKLPQQHPDTLSRM